MTLSVRLYKTLAFSLLGLSGLVCSEGRALNEFKRYSDNLWELEVTSKYFQTSANYLKSGGTFDSLPNGNTYQLLNTDFSARWVPLKNWGFIAGTSLGYAQSKDTTQTRSNSQFNRLFLGTDFILFERGFKLIPELTAVIPLVKADKTSDAAQTAEGATELAGRLIARFDFSRFHNQGYFGVNYRDEGRASLMTYGAGSEIEFHNWFLGGEIAGFTTAQQDTSTANPADRETTSFKVNAQSAIFNSVNPGILNANLWYRYEGAQNSLTLGGGTTLNGTNSAAGQQVFASWVHRFQKTFHSSEPSEPMRPVLDRFKEETHDDVDQNLFRPAPPPPPVAPDEPSPEKKAKAAAALRRKKLQNELKQTEMQMELKLKKKKKSSPPQGGE